MTATHWGAYTAVRKDGKVVSMEPFPGDPNPSSIGLGMPLAITDSVRIQQPMVRKGWLDRKSGSTSSLSRGKGPYVAVSWDQAIDYVVDEIERIRGKYGNGAIYAGSYGWASAGCFHHAKSQLHRFLSLAGGFTFSKNTYSFAAGEVILPHIIGMGTFEQMAVNTPLSMVAEHTDLFVCFGGIPLKNTQVEGGGMGEHHVPDALKACRERGVKFVNFSPIRGDMVDFVGAEWFPTRPNTDCAIMMGLVHTLVENGLHDKTFLKKYCQGFEIFQDYILGKTDGIPKNAEWAGRISGIDSQTIRDLALRMTEGRTLINLSWSTQRAQFGEHVFWMGAILGAVLGQVGLPGGGFGYGYGAVNSVGRSRTPIQKPSLPRQDNPISDFIPVARIADMLLNPGETYHYNGERRKYPDTKMVYWCGGNPFHHHQDLNRLVEAWQKPDTVIVHEPWWNANARHADIILPIATTFERNDIGAGREDRYIFAMQKVIESVGDSLTDYEIFSLLANKLGFHEEFTEGRNEWQWLEHLYDRFRQAASQFTDNVPDLDGLWTKGFYELPRSDPKAFLSDFRNDPLLNPLSTPSGKLEIYSSKIASFDYDDCPGHPIWQEPKEWLGSPLSRKFPLHLITNQPKTRLHSQYDNGKYSLENKMEGREIALMHPFDAQERDICEGDIVKIYNGRGACLSGIKLSDDIMQGVLQLSTGAWYDPIVPGEIGAIDVHGNPNVLTLDIGTSKLAQGPSAMTALVEVEVFEGELPPVKIFAPPEVISENQS